MVQEQWMQTGDTTLAANYWDLLKESTYTQCADNTSQLINFTQCTRQSSNWPTTKDIVDWPTGSRDGYVMTDINTVVNAFSVGSSRALAQVGAVMGSTYAEDTQALQSQANETEAAMRGRLIDGNTGLFFDGMGTDGHTDAHNHSAWHAQTNTLWFNIAPERSASAMRDFLRAKGMVGSVYGAYAMLMACFTYLNDNGKLGFEMMTNCKTNSWCHMLSVNATATMEAWSTAEKPNLSWSHPWASAPATAIVRGLMGLTATSPTYSTWVVKPQPANLTSASIKVPSMKGSFLVAVQQTFATPAAQENTEPSTFSVSVTMPANTKGTICVPAMGDRSLSIAVNGATTTGRGIYADNDSGAKFLAYVCIDNVSTITTVKRS